MIARLSNVFSSRTLPFLQALSLSRIFLQVARFQILKIEAIWLRLGIVTLDNKHARARPPAKAGESCIYFTIELLLITGCSHHAGAEQRLCCQPELCSLFSSICSIERQGCL
jgi:hypothetical protein